MFAENLFREGTERVISMKNITKLTAIAAIACLEAVALYLGNNGDCLIYSIGAIAALGGAEVVEKVKGVQKA